MDANTRAFFCDYCGFFDIQSGVTEKVTVPIYFEIRIFKLSLNAAELRMIDAEFEVITECGEITRNERLETNWAAIEALMGDPVQHDVGDRRAGSGWRRILMLPRSGERAWA
jgi:type I restriction enzyme R subunit